VKIINLSIKNIENIKINHKDVFLFKYRKKFILRNFQNITYIKVNEYDMNIKDLCDVKLKNLEIHLKNTYFHNLEDYALRTMNEVCKCCYNFEYYIEGEKYYKDNFDKHPAVKRNIKAKKLINI
jgi:hypothetical protein